MARHKISRNEPCPCGSGKKYKHCCYGKDIDWSEREATARRPSLAQSVGKPSGRAFGQFEIVDSKLKAIAKAHPERTRWKELIERLSNSTNLEDRMKTYKAIGEAKVIPDEAAAYPILWAIQWMPPDNGRSALTEPEVEDRDEEVVSQELDKETLAQLRKFGVDDLAEMFVSNRREFDRHHERGRQFFYGPPDESLKKHLKSKGIID